MKAGPDVYGLITIIHNYPIAYHVTCFKCGRYRYIKGAKNSVQGGRMLRHVGWRELNGGWACPKCEQMKIIQHLNDLRQPEVPA